jgi:ADP-ribose pyrophosphatase YjhB (NUDIX family)
MPKPVTPLVGCDVFILNENSKLLLVQRSDNKLWALPGGCQDLGETPAQCAIRECFEETGLKIELEKLMGVWSSQCYEYVHYPWKENEFTHLMYSAKVIGGSLRISNETLKVGWFSKEDIPELSDGHSIRITYGYKFLSNPQESVYYE